MTPSLLPAGPDAQHMLDPMSVVWFVCGGGCCLLCSIVTQTPHDVTTIGQAPAAIEPGTFIPHCGEAVNPWLRSIEAITRLRILSCLLLPSSSSLLTDAIPSVPLVPKIAQALLKDKSRVGAEVRNVSVWCAICAQCLCHRACMTTSQSLPRASHAIKVAQPRPTLFAVPRRMACPETVFFDRVKDKTSVCTCLNDSL